MLSKGERLCPHKFATLLFYAAQATFARGLMLLSGHLNIVLWEAARTVISKERAVPSVQDVHFGVCEFGVLTNICCAILVANVFGPNVM